MAMKTRYEKWLERRMSRIRNGQKQARKELCFLDIRRVGLLRSMAQFNGKDLPDWWTTEAARLVKESEELMNQCRFMAIGLAGAVLELAKEYRRKGAGEQKG